MSLLSAENFRRVDPHDPTRALTQHEQILTSTDYAIPGVHTVRRGTSPRELEAALDKYYEWYPVVKKTTVPIDGIFHLREGKIRQATFDEDVKNNPVIRSKTDFHKAMESIHWNYYHGQRYSFGPRLYKVDIPSGSGDNILNEGIEYVLIAPTAHDIFEGKSHRTLHNLFNGWIADRSYKPSIERPQDVPNATYALMPEGLEFKELPPIETGPSNTIAYEKGSKIGKYERGMLIDVRRIEKGKLPHPKGYAVTGALSGVQSFLYLNLLLDYHKDKEEVGHKFCYTFGVTQEKFPKLMEGKKEDMIGNDVVASAPFRSINRSHPNSLRQILDIAQKGYTVHKAYADQDAINSRYRPYIPVEIECSEEATSSLVSNFGDLKMRDGVIDVTSAYGSGYHNIGIIDIILSGQADGSIILAATSGKVAFSRRFIQVYLDLFLHILEISTKRDITREELVSMPEYKELLRELLP